MGALSNLLFTLVVSGLGSVGAFLLLIGTKFGDRLVDFAVSRNLEKYKHSLQAEIEELRARLSRMGDRSVRSNEREYTAIISAWEAYVDFFLKTYNTFGQLNQFGDLNKMSQDDLKRWMKALIPENLEPEMLRASDKNAFYSRYLDWQAIQDAMKANSEARLCLRKQSIFIPRDLEAQFQTALDQCGMALAASKAAWGGYASDVSKRNLEEFSANANGWFEALKDASRKQLMYAEDAKKTVAGPAKAA